MDCYEINEETLAILPFNQTFSKVIERHNEFIVKQKPMDIINSSCLYFGSSYLGRHSATKFLLGISHKSPIVIEESKNIIFFPTLSPRVKNCCWISLKNISTYQKYNKEKSTIFFYEGKELKVPISYGSLDNQVLRAARLESVIRNNKK